MRAILFAAAVVFATGVAHADPQLDAKAKQAADAGIALFNKDDFAGAAAKFEEAYGLNHDPSYLFNIAQAYRHTGNCVRSADYYGRFLSAVPHPPNEDKIRVWYASELQCAKERAANVPVEGPNQEPPKQEPPKQEPPVVTHGGGRHRGLAIALGATSLVAFGVGGFFAWDASYLSDQRASFLAGCSTSDHCSSAVVNDYDRRGSRAQTLAIVGFAAGGVALAAGVTLYLMAGSAESAPPVAITHVEGGAIVTRAFSF